MITILFTAVLYIAPKSIQIPDLGPNATQLEKDVVAREAEGLDCLKTGNLKRFGELTADEAVFVDDHGMASKEEVLKNVTQFTLTDYTMEDIHFVRISGSTGLVAYKITEKGASHGHQFTAKAYVTSVWTKRGRNWLCLSSQETGTK